MAKCEHCKKEPKFRKKQRENAQALTRYMRLVSGSDQTLKFKRFKQNRELLNFYDPVTIERMLLFIQSAALADPFAELVLAHESGISIARIARIRITRFRLAG